MTVSKISSFDGSSQVLALIDDLGDCTDSKQVITAAAARFSQLFGDYAVYAVLLSDRSMERWRLLPVRNPEGPIWGGVSTEELPPDTDMDAIAERLGGDVTRVVQDCPLLREFLGEEEGSFTANSENAKSPLMAEARLLLPLDVQTVLAASWRRPAGGRGCVLLGYTQSFLARDLLKLYALAVKVTTRLSFYPGYVNLVARTERVGESLRRNIVHDLKTPVTVMKGFAETLLLPGVGDDPAMRQELLTAISEQAQRLLDDLKDLLAPLDAVGAPHREEFDLALLLQKTVMSERHTARAASHTFDLAGANQPLMISADRRKVRRVMENLLSNAVKYSPGEGKTVRVALEARDGAALVSFTDQGIGMTEEQLARVMRGTGRAVDQSLGIEGSGFGLDSCRRVLEAHGGTLRAASRPGEGSTFTALLPIAPANA